MRAPARELSARSWLLQVVGALAVVTVVVWLISSYALNDNHTPAHDPFFNLRLEETPDSGKLDLIDKQICASMAHDNETSLTEAGLNRYCVHSK